MTILVVDDEPDYRLVMRSVLMTEGWNVVLAEHGEDALAKLAEGPVDLVIADIYMPIMDGIKLHRKVRADPKHANLPILFVSAFDDQHTLGAVQDPRVDGFLKKARPIEELFEWIRYLTTPEDQRPKTPPSGPKMRAQQRPIVRGSSGTPIY
jgi:CheY-like chemotaxis protein